MPAQDVKNRGNTDLPLVFGLVGGAGLLGYGLYKWLKNNEKPIPADSEFQNLVISGVSPSSIMAGGVVTVTGSFQHKGPGGHYRVIANIGHVPFSNLYEDSGYKNYTLSDDADWKTYNYSVSVDLSSFSSPVASPFDAWVRLYDVDNSQSTGVEATKERLLTVLAATYEMGYSVSPAGAGFYTLGATYGTESGVIENPYPDRTWIDIGVEPRAGYVFDHWDTTSELYYDSYINPNMVKNLDNTTIVAIFVPEGTGDRVYVNFDMQPASPGGYLNYSQDPDGYDATTLKVYIGDKQASFEPWSQYYIWAHWLWYMEPLYELDHWLINGEYFPYQQPLNMIMSPSVTSIIAVMKRT
jgi:hypothetical protein